jgi:3-isopropylmalate/(R)-2-methylmalate dehydratase small subunit
MKPFTTLTTQVIPIDMKNVNTDMIIPAQHLAKSSTEGYGQYLFQRLRETDLHFICNDKRFRKAEVLAAGDNFGPGSSREHAIWALLQWGIKVVIAPSFADIFYNNALKNGLVLVKLPNDIVKNIIKNSYSAQYSLTVDLKGQKVTLPNAQKYSFPFDPFRKECILNGLSDIDYIMSHETKIRNFEKNRAKNTLFDTRA